MRKPHNPRNPQAHTVGDRSMKALAKKLAHLRSERLHILEQLRLARTHPDNRQTQFARQIAALQKLDNETYRLETIQAGVEAVEVRRHIPARPKIPDQPKPRRRSL